MLTMSSEKCINSSWIKTNDGTVIKCAESLKLLGFTFNKNLNCNTQITNLIRKATGRSFVLRHYSKFMPCEDFKKMYCSRIRSVLEFSSVSFTSQISKFPWNHLENVQKRCLKIMYGNNYSYLSLIHI